MFTIKFKYNEAYCSYNDGIVFSSPFHPHGGDLTGSLFFKCKNY